MDEIPPARPAIIHKDPARLRVPPHARELDGLPGGALNIAHEAVDRHVLPPPQPSPKGEGALLAPPSPLGEGRGEGK